MTTDFRAAAKAAGYFASGDMTTGYRIAVTGKRMFERVAAFAQSQGATVSPNTNQYPQLMHITKGAQS